MPEDECMTGHIGTFFSRSSNCRGDITFESNTATIDCSECSGVSDLSNKDCFRGSSTRLPPGFNGKVILRSHEDRGFNGSMIEAISSYSDIHSMLVSLHEKGKGMGPLSQLGNEIGKAEDLFKEDPVQFLKGSDKFRSRLKKMKGSDMILPSFDDIVDRTSLMIRKLQRVEK